VNPHVSESRDAEIAIRGASVKSGSVTTLTHSDIHAHNSFEQRDAVKPQTTGLQAGGKVVHHTFPPASVTKLELTLE
jgi:alpha-N-arabinofuranosidase